jgi:hypothetical protein
MGERNLVHVDPRETYWKISRGASCGSMEFGAVLKRKDFPNISATEFITGESDQSLYARILTSHSANYFLYDIHLF